MNDIVITCTVLAGQQGLFKACIESFQKNLLGIDFNSLHMCLNIDSTGNHQADRKPFEAILEGVFKTYQVRAAGTANFSFALEAVWRKALWMNPKYILHIEGDWLLEKQVKFSDLVEPLLDPECYATTLRYYPFKEPKLCLMPSLWKSQYIEQFLGKGLNTQINPEWELRSRVKEINKDRVQNKQKQIYNCHFPKLPQRKVLIDLGTDWKRGTGLRANGIGKNYTQIN